MFSALVRVPQQRSTSLLPVVSVVGHQRRGTRASTRIREWHKALLFMPDDLRRGQHHAFLPSLRQYQDEMEAIRNPVTINDIGLSEEQFTSVAKKPVTSAPVPRIRRRAERAADATAGHKVQTPVDITNLTPDALIKLVDVKVEKKQLDYAKLQFDYLRSAEGKSQTLELAHHYHIYRDLFSSPSQVPIVDPVPKVQTPAFMPYPDRILSDMHEEWFPGSVRWKKPVPRQIYHFMPHVPIVAEFAVSERKIAAEEEADETGIDPDSLIASPVHTGNIITPLYCSEKPTVLIDARVEEDGRDCGLAAKVPGSISVLTDSSDKFFYTLALLNLDSTLGDEKPVCHWMVSNITSSNYSGQEVMSYMPVYGIRGLGYHRFVFLLLRHEKEISVRTVTDFDFKQRIVDPLQLVESQSATPIGLSWFQSTWDSYTQTVFHEQLNMKSPVYEYIEPEMKLQKQVKHPFAAPFNVYLDHFRDPKELNKEALLMRLKKVNPFDYSKEFEKDPLPNAYGEIRDIEPSWRQSTVWKQRNRVGPFRHLRPSSAKLPNNNNADLDYPIWPPPRRHHVLNKYPPNVRQWKSLRETKWVIPVNEHPQYRIVHNEDPHEVNKEDASEKD